MTSMLTLIPSADEIKNVVYTLKNDGASGLMVLKHFSFTLIGRSSSLM
jgi:hypothetical protein